ncbi:substrate-binding domain-containing protein [Humisphaera borealis]|uniref:Substrate-binding domain-containing protein n=1 Tax=Humisphaera borealis TaxID=2807512 RepID=A0A7M2X198_9BACT|nr:substrate-binding domain-containing protein [Humisphaera borealis]QOV90510.1 substrate-binding domain-containing protein [Humisphaera borealis]
MTFRSSLNRLPAFLAVAALVCSGVCGCKRDDAANTSASSPARATKVHKAPDGAAIKLAFVTNNPDPFWNLAAAGVRKYVEEATARGEKVTVDVKIPQKGEVGEQNQILESLVAQGYHGIAVTALSPDAQVPEINRAAEKTNVLCHDSDAPKSNRLVYIGTNNYEAGKRLGEQIVAMKLLPNGGKAAVFVGTMSADNARERYRGVQDAVKSAGIELLQAKEDAKKGDVARTNVESVINGQADVKLLIGLWAYNGPAIADVVKGSPRKAELKIACFDENDATLEGVEQGLIQCTVVQKPFQFGYQSSKLLHELAVKGEAAMPKSDQVDTGVTVITNGATSEKTQNVKEFKAELEKMKK